LNGSHDQASGYAGGNPVDKTLTANPRNICCEKIPDPQQNMWVNLKQINS
jgi:hypothetical protein